MLPEDAWIKIDVRDGEKGPTVIEAVKCRVQARTDTGGTGSDEILFITRERQADNTYKIDYYLSMQPPMSPCRNWPTYPRQLIASKNASGEPKEKPVWQTIR